MIKIEIKNFGFDHKILFKNLEYTFYENNLYILKGENGSGKSTLINFLALNEFNDSIKICFDDVEISKNNINSIREEFISYLPQNSLIFDDLTCLENVLLPYSKKDKLKATKILISLGLEKTLKQKASSLSSGEKQRLAFARIVYECRKVILIDEINSSLDKESALIINNKIQELAKDHLIIFISHEDISCFNNFVLLELKHNNLVEIKTSGAINKDDGKLLKNFKEKKFNNSLINLLKYQKGLFIWQVIVIILTFCTVIIVNSMSGSMQVDRLNNFVLNEYINTAPAISVRNTEEVASFIKSTKNEAIYANGLYKIDTKDKFKAGQNIFGIISSDDITQYSLIVGNYPRNSDEILVSSYYYSVHPDINIGESNIFISNNSFVISGVYQGNELNNYEKRLAKLSDNLDSLGNSMSFLISYSYLIDNAITIKLTSTNYLLLKNNESNRKILTKENVIFISYNLNYPILVKNDGSKCNFPFATIGKDTFDDFYNEKNFGTLAICLLFFGAIEIVFCIGYYYRNKKFYYFLKMTGYKMKELYQNTTVINLFGLAFGVIIGLTVSLLFEVSLLALIGFNLLEGNLFSLFYFSTTGLSFSIILTILNVAIFSVFNYVFVGRKNSLNFKKEIKRK